LEDTAGNRRRAGLAVAVQSGGTLGRSRIRGKFIFGLSRSGRTGHRRGDDATGCRAPSVEDMRWQREIDAQLEREGVRLMSMKHWLLALALAVATLTGTHRACADVVTDA